MLNENTKFQDELATIMNNLADSVLELSDEGIKLELEDEGDNSEEVRQILLDAVKSCRQQNLREAKKRYEENALHFQQRQFNFPVSPEEKRNLLHSLMDGLASLKHLQLTWQNRDFKDIPDEDLDGYLRQVFELKAIADNTEND